MEVVETGLTWQFLKNKRTVKFATDFLLFIGDISIAYNAVSYFTIVELLSKLESILSYSAAANAKKVLYHILNPLLSFSTIFTAS